MAKILLCLSRRRTSWIESRQEETRWRWTDRAPKKLWKKFQQFNKFLPEMINAP